MAIGNEIQDVNADNFPFLPINDSQQLNIRVELGYFKIPRNNRSIQDFASQSSTSLFYPAPGDKRGESFVNNSILRRLKSSGLKKVVNGFMPTHMDTTGAPYCTFIEGSITTKAETHPYYDLIKAPPGESNYEFQSTAPFSIKEPLILQQNYASVNNATSKQFNKLGVPFIPSTTKTSTAVKDSDLKPLTTYNIWTVDNINKKQFNLVENLGFVPKSGTQASNLQPYAQTWPFTDAAQIQVYASNSQVSLTRKYPISKDYAHDEKCKYLIFDESQIKKTDVGLSNKKPVDPNDKLSFGAVGFTIKFTQVVVSNTIPTGASNEAVLTEPRMIISWGALNEPNKYTDKNKISLYTLEISPNRPPRLYFNIGGEEIKNKNVDPNHNFIELASLKQIVSSDRNSGAKTHNSYELYVYYTGEYLKIGNSNSPDTWEIIKSQTLQITNGNSYVTRECSHYLNSESKINILAQYMNFSFMYGPPIFDPHDDQNLTGLTGEDLANSLNYVRNQSYTSLDASTFNKTDIQKNIVDFVSDNSIRTFQKADEETPQKTVGGASVYIDSRCTQNNIDCSVSLSRNDGQHSEYSNLLSYKVTLPQNLGGSVYSKFFEKLIPNEPRITESYIEYFTDVFEDGSVESILTQAVSEAFTVTKSVDNATLTKLSSSLKISFINLNRSDSGNTILQFMRKNVSAIRISAGYGEDVKVFFEGMITGCNVTEHLSESVIKVEAEDLITKLFVDADTSIVSKNYMKFPGMKFYDTINTLVEYTELKNHFEYSLSSQLLHYVKTNGLPRIPDSALFPALSSLEVKAYQTEANYFALLSKIATLCLQVNDPLNPTLRQQNFDIPIFYWKSTDTTNGIVMSSRKRQIDKDKFYIRKASISKLLTDNIKNIHGYITDSAGFESNSSSNNLQALGLLRYTGIDGSTHSIYEKNPNAFGTVDINATDGYIGYDRVTIFDKPGADLGPNVLIPTILLPNEKQARTILHNYMLAFYETVYENIQISALVTAPLKEWGFFTVCVESDDIEIPEEYLYDSVTYRFDITENLIKVDISGAKKAITNI